MVMKCVDCLLCRLSVVTLAMLWLQTDQGWALASPKSLGQLLLGDITDNSQSHLSDTRQMSSPTTFKNLLESIEDPEDASIIASTLLRRYWESRNKRPRLHSRIRTRNGAPFPESIEEKDAEGVGLLGLDNHDFIVSTLDRHRTRPLVLSRQRPSGPLRQESHTSPFLRQLTVSKPVPGMMRSSVSVTDLRTLMQDMQELHNAGR